VTSDNGPEKDGFFSRVQKYIPADIIGIYLTGSSIAQTAGIYFYWSFICVLALFVWRAATPQDTTAKFSWREVQCVSVAISGVAFVIWVYATGGVMLGIKFGTDEATKAIGQLGTLLWPVICSGLFHGDIDKLEVKTPNT
jgi:hypothetical protein